MTSDNRMSTPQPVESRLYDLSFLLAFSSQTCFVIANTLMAHYSRWIEFLGGNLQQVGWIMGAGAAAGLLFRPWLAQWINHIGAKATWGMGYGIFSLAALANLMLEDLGPLIYLARSANVLGAAIVFASSLTYISQIAPERRRTEAIGILGVGGFLGMLIGPFLGDVFLSSVIRERGQFVSLFITAGAANLVPAILLFFVRSPPHKRGGRAVRISDFVSTVRRHWPGSILLIDLAFGVCMTIPFVFAASYIDEVGIRLPGVSELGFFFWFYAGPGLLLRIALRRLPELVGPQRVMLVGMAIMALGMFSFFVVSAERPWLLALPALLCGVGHSLTFHTMTSLTIQPFPTEVRGTGSALALMMLDLGMFIGAPILGLIGFAFGYPALFASVGVFAVTSSVIYYFTTPGNRAA